MPELPNVIDGLKAILKAYGVESKVETVLNYSTTPMIIARYRVTVKCKETFWTQQLLPEIKEKTHEIYRDSHTAKYRRADALLIYSDRNTHKEINEQIIYIHRDIDT